MQNLVSMQFVLNFETLAHIFSLPSSSFTFLFWCPFLFPQVTARVSSRPLLELQSFDSLVDHSCLEDQEKKGGLFSKVIIKSE